jgi:hypothetical protein
MQRNSAASALEKMHSVLQVQKKRYLSRLKNGFLIYYFLG